MTFERRRVWALALFVSTFIVSSCGGGGSSRPEESNSNTSGSFGGGAGRENDAGAGGDGGSDAGATGGPSGNAGEGLGGKDGGPTPPNGGSGSSDCTFQERGVTVVVWGKCTATVTIGAKPPVALASGASPLGPVVTLEGLEGGATVYYGLDENEAKSDYIAVRLGKEGTFDPIPHKTEVDIASYEVTSDGTYLLVSVEPVPLPGCETEIRAGNFDVKSNAELEALRDASFIGGGLRVHAKDATDLSALSCLRSVGGDLLIEDSPALTSAAALANLVKVHGSATFQNNAALVDIELPELILLGPSLQVTGNAALERLNAQKLVQVVAYLNVSQNGATAKKPLALDFAALELVRGNTSIQENPKLQNLDGFVTLSRIDGFLEVGENAALASVAALVKLETVADYVAFDNNDVLPKIDLSRLTRLGLALSVLENDALASVDVSKLPEMVSNLYITGNGRVSGNVRFDFTALTAIHGSVDIVGNPGLKNLSGFESVKQIDRYLNISDNPALTETNGFAGVEGIGGFSFILNNAALTSVNLSGLTTLIGDLSVENNDALASLNFGKLREASSSVKIAGNGNLAPKLELNFAALKKIAGGVTIQANPKLPNLSGLEALTEIGGLLHLWSNAGLTNTDALKALESVGAWISVYENNALTSLDLSGLTRLGGTFTVNQNASLPNCQATAVRDALVSRGWKDDAVIVNNHADGCPEDL